MTDTRLGTVLQRLLGRIDSPLETTDHDLIERFRHDRDEGAFGRLVDRHGPLVLAISRRMLGNAADVEDVFQATFLVLARKANKLDGRRPLSPWLHTVARNLALKARLSAKRRRAVESQACARAPRPAQEDGELRAVIDEELGRLPEKYRVPVTLCYLAGKTNEEAARELGCPVGTVHGRLAWARETLRTRLTRRGFVLPAGGLAALVAAESAPARLLPEIVQVAVGRGTVRPVVQALVQGYAGTIVLARGTVLVAGLLLFLTGAGVGGYLTAPPTLGPSEKTGAAPVEGAPVAAPAPKDEKVLVESAPKESWSNATLSEKEEVKRWTEDQVKQCRAKFANLKRPLLTPFVPQSVENVLIYRTFDQVAAVNLTKHGDFEWWHDTDGGVRQLLHDTIKRQFLQSWADHYQKNGPAGALLQNSVASAMATDGVRVVAVDDLALPPPAELSGLAQYGPLTEAIKQNILNGINIETGKLMWQLGGKFDESDFKSTVFLGAPVCLGGRYYLINEKRGELRLACLLPKDTLQKPHPPELLWSCPLGKAEPTALDFNRRTRAATVAVGEGTIVCVTNTGVVAAVSLDGTLRWTFPYRDKKALPAAGQDWSVVAPIIQDGKVVFTAPDKEGVYCVSLKQGTLLWNAEPQDGLYLAGVGGDAVLIVGLEGIRALRLLDGKPAWERKVGQPTGFGTWLGPFYFLPVRVEEDQKERAELVVLRATDGQVRGRFRSQEPFENLHVAGTTLISQSPTRIKCYPLADFALPGKADSLSEADCKAVWNDLNDPSPARHGPAQSLLTLVGPGMLPFLSKEMQPVLAADAKRLARLLKDLDDRQPEVRVRATEELIKLKDLAEPALREMLANKPPLEVAKRVEEILSELPDELPEQRRTLWVIDHLGRLGTSEANQLLGRIGAGEPNSRITRAARATLLRINKGEP